jgi:phosphoribosylamine--glycine ligase
MKVLVIGNGGRESAIIQKLQESPKLTKLYCAPGIDALENDITNISIAVTDIEHLKQYVLENDIELTVVGPEAPLVLGIVDEFEAAGLRIIGPTKAAALLESSKAFSKSIMEKYHIPTARYRTFTDFELATAYLESLDSFPVVIKASGLAAGKGVVITENLEIAKQELREMMLDKKFGDSGDEVVIESFLLGEEASVFALCDGANYVTLLAAQDHKRIGEGDTGKNTGGMGAYAPAPVVTADVLRKVEQRIIEPLLAGMSAEGSPYTGVLFVGLMIEKSEPSVVEFNVRFGDPETQVVLSLLKTDLLELFLAMAAKQLKSMTIENAEDESALTVVLVSGGYPDAYEKGFEITGLNDLDAATYIHHAGTRLQNNKLVTNGGRVLNVVAKASTLLDAAKAAYGRVAKINFKDMYYRKDIGHRVLK